MRILTLDDMQTRQDAFARWFIGHTHDFAMDAPSAIKLLDSFDYDLVMLDHDLAEEHYLTMSEGMSEERQPGAPEYSPGTGMDVVDFIINMPAERRPHTVIVHSYNTPRAIEMRSKLKDVGIVAYRVPFGSNPLK